jgi:hypothetical protein
MNRYLRITLLLTAIGSFVFLIVLFFLPTRWDAARRRDIAAPPERIWPHLEDLRAWKDWSPWKESSYPGLVFHYSEPSRGPGAQVSWDSDATSDGVLRIESAQPPRTLTFSMAFQQGRIRATDTLRLEPLPGGRTRVHWSDQGTLGRTLLGRLSLPVIEASMGRDQEHGLAALAALVEGESASATSKGTPASTSVPAPAAVTSNAAAASPGDRPASTPVGNARSRR